MTTTIVTRSGKGSPLTNTELDANFSNLKATADAAISSSGNNTLNGNLIVTGDLEVQGTTTSIDSTTVEITDLNITLAKDASNATQANGAGITIAGSNAELKYVSTGDKWTLNKNLEVTGTIQDSNGTFLPSSSVSTFGGTLIDDADAAAARTTLGLGTAATSATGDFLAISGGTLTGTLQGTRLGLGVAPHATAALNITTTNQHIRLNNGSELGVISLLSEGELDIWGHGDGETINFRTGSGSGTVALAITGTNSVFSGSVTANAGVVVDNITIDGFEIDSSSSLILDIAGNLTIDVDGTFITLADGGSNWGQFFNSQQNFFIKNPTSNKDILFQGVDEGASITALTLDMSNAGAATFNSTISSGGITSTVNNTASVAQIATDSNAVLLLENTNASGSAGIRLRGGNGAGVLMYGENNNTDKFHLVPRNDTSKAFTLDHVGAAEFSSTISSGAITSSGVVTANDYIDLNNVGNRGKIGYDSNNVFIASTSSVGSIIFKNNVTSTVAPQTDGDTLLTLADGGNATFSGSVSLLDNQLLMLGTGNDARLKFDTSTNALMITATNGTADNIRTQSNNLSLEQANGAKYISATANDSVKLYHADTPVVKTTAGGLVVESGMNFNMTGSMMIGATTAPSAKFQVQGSDSSDVAVFHGTTGGNARGLKISLSGEGATNQVVNLDSMQDFGILAFKTAGTERGRFNSSGLSVTGSVTSTGLTVNAAQSNFNDSAGAVIAFQKSSSAKAWIANRSYGFHDGNGLAINTTDANPIRFGTNNSEVARLTSSGHLGIGTTTVGTLHGVSYGTTQLHIDGKTDRGQMIIEGDTLSLIAMSDNSATANSRVFLSIVNDGLMEFRSVNDDGTSKATIMSMTSAGATTFSGSVTSTGLTVSSGIDISSANTFIYLMESDTTDVNTLLQGNQSAFSIKTVNDAKSVFTERFKISHSTGDIGFFNDAGNQGLFFDSSTSRLGLGTTSPATTLHVKGTTAKTVTIERASASNAANLNEFSSHHALAILNRTSGSYLMFSGNSARTDIQATDGAGTATAKNIHLNPHGGNIGIGTGQTSPDSKLSVTSSTINSEDIVYLKSGADNVNDYLGIAWELGIGGNGPHAAIRASGGPSANDCRLGFYTTSDGGTNLTEGLFLAHNGGVSIGTTTTTGAGGLIVDNDIKTNSRFGVGSLGNVATPAIHVLADTDTGIYFPDFNHIGLVTGGVERLQITSAGKALFKGAAQTGYALFDDGVNGGIHLKADTSSVTTEYITTGFGAFEEARFVASNFVFKNSGTSTRAVIDSSGNFMVGKTTQGLSNAGFEVAQTGQASATQSGASCLRLNRLSSDGELLQFRKDGSQVGSIQSRSGAVTTMIFDPRSNGSGISGTTNGLIPTNQSGTPTNNHVDLGSTTNKFKDLHLNGVANAAGFQSNQTTTGFGYINFGDTDDSNIGQIGYDHTDNYMRFQVNNTEKVRIDSSGRLLIGGTSASASGTTSFSSTGAGQINLNASSTGGQCLLLRRVNHNGNAITFENADEDEVGSITMSSNATAYNTSSDARLKDNIEDADDSGTAIDSLQVRQFDWKSNGKHEDYGMIAQEVIHTCPNAVSVPQEDGEMMGIDYSKMVPLLLKEIQELRKRVKKLEE